MRKVYLFNPENDLAMACGSQRYDAPKSARRLAADLSLLPIWFAEPGSLVLTGTDVPSDYLPVVRQTLGLDVTWVSEPTYPSVASADDSFSPWGWSLPLLYRLQQLTQTSSIVDVPYMERLRYWSNRERTVDLLSEMKTDGLLSADFPVPFLGRTMAELSEQASKWNGNCLLKAPWSGSGKGLRWLKYGWDESILGWCRNILCKQKSVICEYHFDKVVDFAMEFSSKNGDVQFEGYSLFNTFESGTYRSNVLTSNASIEKRLATYVDSKELMSVRNALIEIFEKDLSSFYTGFFGVDMMICRTAENTYFVHPCVEINLRYNMGVVSRILFDRYFAEGVEGEYCIIHAASTAELLQEADRLRLAHPLQISDGRITAGFLLLTYIGEEAEYMAYCIV